jgi:aspartate racemase
MVGRAATVLGVIGGMGPWATIDFLGQLHRLQRVEAEQDFLPVVVSCDPNLPDRTVALRGGRADEITRALRQRALALRGAGATMLAMPCNTAHAFAEPALAAIGLPLVDMLAAVAEETRRRCPETTRAVVLATDGTMRSGLYDQALAAVGVAAHYPTAAQRRELSEVIAALKVAGPAAPVVRRAAATINAIVAALAPAGRSPGRPTILGCTELPLAREHVDPGHILIDSTRCLAEAVLRASGLNAAAQPA